MNSTQPVVEEASRDTTSTRVCVVSQRGLHPEVARCGFYEFEDVIVRVDAADLVVPEPLNHTTPYFAQKVSRRLRDSFGLTVSREPRIKPITLTKDYDLLFVPVQRVQDLRCLESIHGWQERCAVKICWVEELWAWQLKWRKLLEPLRHFDHVFVFFRGTEAPLAELIDRPCTCAPPGIDAQLFCPYPAPPARCIDVYHMGRRSASTHEALFELARQGKIHYIYDSAHLQVVIDPAQHRALLASFIKRSRYFFAYKAKVNRHGDTAGQEELATRFFEGAAGGAVLLGMPPDCDTYREHFDWPDAVIPVPFDSTRVEGVLAELDAQPDRLEAIRRANVLNTLQRHDWVYRWNQVVKAAGLKPAPGAVERESVLNALADSVAAGPA